MTKRAYPEDSLTRSGVFQDHLEKTGLCPHQPTFNEFRRRKCKKTFEYKSSNEFGTNIRHPKMYCSRDCDQRFADAETPPTTGSCITTTSQPLYHLPRNQLCGKSKGLDDFPATLQSERDSSGFFLFLCLKGSTRERHFGTTGGIQGLRCTFKNHSGEGLPWCIWCMEITLKEIYRCRGRVFCNLLVRCTDLVDKLFIIDSILLLSGPTLYYIFCALSKRYRMKNWFGWRGTFEGSSFVRSIHINKE